MKKKDLPSHFKGSRRTGTWLLREAQHLFYLQLYLRRTSSATPTSPVPNRARVPGSGDVMLSVAGAAACTGGTDAADSEGLALRADAESRKRPCGALSVTLSANAASNAIKAKTANSEIRLIIFYIPVRTGTAQSGRIRL
jgi:hypothetical protein